MGWQDDPIVEETEEEKKARRPQWMNDPVVEDPKAVKPQWMTDPVVEDNSPRVKGDVETDEKGRARVAKMRGEAGIAPIGEAANEREAWAADTPEKIKAAKGFLKRKADSVIKDAWFPGITTTAQSIGADLISIPSRVLGTVSKDYEQTADYMNRYADALNEAKSETDTGWEVTKGLKRGARGATRSIGEAMLAGPAGVPAVIGVGVTTQANQSVTEGRDAGLKGPELAAYAASQGALEGGIEAIAQKMGFGAVESIIGGKEALVTGLKAALGQLVKTTGKEVLTEEATSMSQQAVKKLYDVDPKALDLDTIWKVGWDTAIQSAMGASFVTAPNVLMAAAAQKDYGPAPTGLSEDTKTKIVRTALDKTAPSRETWKQWGLDPKLGEKKFLGNKARKDAVRQWSQEYMTEEREKILGALEVPKGSTVSQVPPDITEGTPAVQESTLPKMDSEGQPIQENWVQTPQEPVTPPQQMTPEESEVLFKQQPDAQPTTGRAPQVSAMFEVMDDLMRRRGKSPLERGLGGSFEQYFQDATDQIKANNLYPDEILSDLESSPRPATSTETAALVIRKWQIEKAYDSSSARLAAVSTPTEGGFVDEVKVQREQNTLNELDKQLDRNDAILHRSGSEKGAALNAQKLGLLEDFSLATMRQRARNAKGGKPLTQEESDSIGASHAKIQQAEADAQDHTENREIERGIEAAKPPKSGMKISAAKKRLKVAWDEFDKAMGGIKPENLVTGESGALNLEVLAAGAKLVKAHIDVGTATFGEFMADAKRFIGDRAESYRDSLKEVWEKTKAATGIPGLEYDPTDPGAMIRIARKIEKSVVNSGIYDREAVVKEVHSEMKSIIPDVTERQVREAMTKYGIREEFPDDKTSRTIFDINGQIRQLLKLQDMANKVDPQGTGQILPEQSQAFRELTKLVNDAKKSHVWSPETREGMLKSALASAKTAATNDIADMDKEIRLKEKTLKKTNTLVPDAELIALLEKRAAKKAEWDLVFPKEPATEAQRLVAIEKSLDSAIRILGENLKSGHLEPNYRPDGPTSPAIEAKRARLKELNYVRDTIMKMRYPKMSQEERDSRNYTTSLLRQAVKWQEKRANKAFQTYEIGEKTRTEGQTKLKYQVQQFKEEYQNDLAKWKRQTRSKLAKAWGLIPEGFNFSRALMTSMDLSAVLRQGGLVAAAHPILAAKAFPEMFEAFASKQGEFDAMENIRNRDNYSLYQRAKLAITVTVGKLTNQEEAFMGRWAAAIPLVAGSERAYVTFLNRMRADVFDAMAATVGIGGKVTTEEAKLMASYINIATGRGELGQKMAGAATALSAVFFAPRYAVSKFQYLSAYPLLKSMYKAGPKSNVTKAIAMEYAKSIAGTLLFQSVLMGIYNAFKGEGDPPATFETNPLSSDAYKIKIGDVRIDNWGGLMQTATLLARIAWRERKNATGERESLVDGGFGAKTLEGTIGDFLKNKMSPAWSTSAELWSGKTATKETPQLPDFVRSRIGITGQPSTTERVSSTLLRGVLPMSFRDIYEAEKELGMEKGTALAGLVILGSGMQVYDSASPAKFGKLISQHEKLFGRNQQTKEIFDYRHETQQMIDQAKEYGYSREEIERDMVADMKAAKAGPEAIANAKKRLRSRYR